MFIAKAIEAFVTFSAKCKINIAIYIDISVIFVYNAAKLRMENILNRKYFQKHCIYQIFLV